MLKNKQSETYDYLNFIESFVPNLKWYQKLVLRIMLIFPKGKKEAELFNSIVRGHRIKIKPFDDTMNKTQ